MQLNRSLGEMIEDVVLGTKFTLVGATAYSLYVLGLFALRGSQPFERQSTSVLSVILAYYVAALLAGTVIGILLPLGHSKWGKALIGSVASIPVYASAAISVQGFAPWSTLEVVLLLLVSVGFGSIVGLAIHSVFQGDE